MGKNGGHKKENTFRFQTFSERLSNVNIDVIHQIRHHDDAPEEKGTYFGEALDKHSELNLTDHFSAFRREIVHQVQTFEQLVHHEAEIVAALKKHLVIPGSMALPDLLDLLVQLARDLQMDFYRHFRDFFDILIKLLDVHIQDVEILESTFTCLSYIFKFLWRYLVKDIQNVYGYFSALLGTQYKEYIRNFAAESFAFLMRKVKDTNALVDFLLASLKENPDKCAGVGRLLFEMVKGVKGQFHSCMPKVFPLLLQKLGPLDKQSISMLPWQQVEVAIATMAMSLTQHATKESIQEVWTMLMTALTECHNNWQAALEKRTQLADEMAVTMERLLRLMTCLTEYKNGLMMSDPNSIGKLLMRILKGPCLPSITGEITLTFTSALLLTSHAKMEVQTTSKLVPLIFKTGYPSNIIYDFTRSLFNLPIFEKDCLPALLPYCQARAAMDTGSFNSTLLLVTQLVLCKCPPVQDGSQLERTATYMLDFGGRNLSKSFPSMVASILDDYVTEAHQDLSRLWCALICLPHVRPLSQRDEVIQSIAKFVCGELETSGKESQLLEDVLFVVSQAVSTLVLMLQNKQLFHILPVQSIMQLLIKNSKSVNALRMADIFLTHAVTENQSEILTLDRFKEIYPFLQENLSSPHSMVRLLTLRILSSFELPVPSVETDAVDVFKICLCVETTAANVHDYRDKLRHLQKLEHEHVQKCLPQSNLQQAPLRFLIGCLFVNFNLLWKPIRELIAGHAHKMPRDAFWEVYANHLEKAAEGAEEMLLKPQTMPSDSAIEDSAKDVSTLFAQWRRSQGVEGSKADYTNFRLQLWMAMSDFPEQCQPKSRLFVPLLFRFLKNEYYITDLSLAPTQNLLKQSRVSRLQAVVGIKEEKPEPEIYTKKRMHQKEGYTQAAKRTKTSRQSSDDDEEDDEEETGVTRTGMENGGISRMRTRSQCSVSESEDTDSKIPTRIKMTKSRICSQSQSSTSENDSAGKRASTTLANKGRIRTRSQCSVDEEMAVDTSPVSSPSKGRIRTRSQTEDGGSVDTMKDSARKAGKGRTRMRTRSQCEGDEIEYDEDSTSEIDEIKMDIDLEQQKTGRGKKGKPGLTGKGSSIEGKNAPKGKKGEAFKKRLSAIGEREETDKEEKDLATEVSDVTKSGGFEKTRKAATSALIVHLQVFAKLKDPKSLYMEPKLKELYFDLLIHKNVGVQKMSFQCIMTYKFKYLTPYKENFERLLDDASFKNEIVLFSVDHENTIIATEHRAELLPVLMRILYGKMFVKTGKGTSGKQFSGIRQSIVFRFLSGCQPDELKAFIDLVFAPFKQFIADDPYKMVKDIKDSLDLTKVLPLSRISGALNSYNLIFKKLGHLLDQYLPSLVQMIVGMARLAHLCLESRDRLAPYSLHQLKSIRQETVYRIIQVFTDYDMYDWKPVEIDAIFEAIVWPQLDKLSYEGLNSPTPLLRFLNCLAKNHRYFNLLAKHHPDDANLSPLPHVMKLLVHKDVSAGVASFIMNMISNLLEPKEGQESEMEEGEEKFKVVEVNHMIPLASDGFVKETDIGTRLLLPHIKDILVHIERAVTRLQTKSNRKPDKELQILSKISVFVRDEETCKTLANLLLPFLGKKIAISQQTEEDILTSIHNLLKLVSDCDEFYLPVCQLFSAIRHRNSRNILCDLFWVVCKGSEDLRNLAVIVRKLNSWDKKRVEEPDYMLRLEGFRLANSLVKDMVVIDTKICTALIHNSCFFITNVEDMSLRDSSTHCLVTMVKQLREGPCEDAVYAQLIRNGLLVEVRSGLRHKTEAIRHEFITVLTTIVDTFGDQSAFSTMKLLRDSDAEADFYENIRHIQMHRRTRALRRLIKFLLANRLSVNALLSYLLPIVSAFVGDETYKKHSGLVDAAIDAIGIICQQLPWKHYLHILKHYLQLLSKKLQNQKQLVKVIVAVLDAFHFDLSKSTFCMRLNPRVAMGTTKQENKDDTKANDKEEEVVLFADEEEDKPVPEINEAADDEEMAVIREKIECPEPLATKIHETIVKNVIGQLNKVLTQKIRSELEHKLVRKSYAEDDEILRVPIALAMVKLLHNLPQGALERYLPGILLKVCNFLKSRSNDIRNTSRDTLIRIQMALGPRFFPFILSELKGILKRGYQRHVLCYTVHALLNNMADTVRPGDIDVCLGSLQEVFNEEIFGEVSDEKEVEGIVAKVFEARSSKSYDSYLLMAKYIGSQSLLNFMKPLKMVLETTHSHKSARKVQDVLKQVIVGLMDNHDMTVETLLVFVHGLVSETLPLIAEKKVEAVPKTSDQLGRKPESCLILPQEAPRGGHKPKASKKTNQHVLVEFGLQLLNTCLKKGKIVSTDKDHLQMLDPLVPHLADCLFSKYVKVNADCLRVLCWILRFDLPSVVTHASKIANGMFILLRNYASAGAAKGDNKELVSMAFKAVTVLVRDLRHHKIDDDQLNVLLTFCEEDLHDYTRQSTAFSLLKAILSRKLNVPELHELMKKVEEMSITAEAPHVQRQCRQVMLQYLLDYPLGNKVKKHLEFYVSQLSYERENGRESALEMMAAFFTSFPQNLLFEYSGLFFIPMSANLVNDDSAKCRKLTALAIKSLLEKLDHNNRSNLFKIAMKWLMDEKLRHRVLGAQLCGLFVEVEGAKFELRLDEVLPLVEQQLEPGKYEQVKKNQSMEHDEDHMIYNTLNSLLKMLRECGSLLTDQKWKANMNVIWEYVQSYLTYPHVWVQLISSQLFGLLFASWEPEQLISLATDSAGPDSIATDIRHQYLAEDTNKKLRQLTFDLMTQFQSEFINEDIANQIIKNMVFIAKCARLMDDRLGPDPEPSEGDTQTQRRLTLAWLVRKMTREAHHEAIHQTKASIKRKNVFKWFASVCLDLGVSMPDSLLRTILPPLQREISDHLTTQDPDLKALAQEVVELIKKVVGLERFTEVYASSQKARVARKEERKANKALQAVANPEVAAKRKIKKNLAKKEAKKRKIEAHRPSKKLMKKKYKDFAMKD